MTSTQLKKNSELRQRPREREADSLRLVHPELRKDIAASLGLVPRVSQATLGQFRVAMEQWSAPILETVPVERRVIIGADHNDITVYVINAKPGTSRPAILHTHGGGFVAGAARFDIRLQQEIAAELDCVSVTVEYRLAPETTWRGSVADNYAALLWLYRNAAEFGADASRIALLGESAGGGHAALLAIEARNRGEVPIVLQCLIYPMLDDRTGSSRRAAPGIGTMIWTEPSNRFGWGAFLGMPPGGPDVPPAAVPARVIDLARLPQAFIGVGALDLFVEEDLVYAQRLISAGVPTEMHVALGAPHGFDGFVPDASVTRHFNKLKMDAFRRAFGTSGEHSSAPLG